jgi:mRNA interferase RelE/StbE
LAYNIVFEEPAKKQLKKLPKNIAVKILDYLEEIAKLDNPKARGEGLSANLAGYWRYRIGDYRVVCKIENEILLIKVIKVGHRKDIYE